MMARGYSERNMDKEIRVAKRWRREEVLKKVEAKGEDEKVNLVLTQSAYLPNVSKILKNNFHHMRIEGLEEVFSGPPRLSLRKGKSIGNMIVDATSRTEPGSSGCCGKCILCPNMKSTKQFKDQQGKTFDIRSVMTCETIGVVYAMECGRCEKIIYVGKTSNSVRQRFYGHRSDFTHQDMDSPAGHFLKDGHRWEDLKVVCVEEVRGNDDHLRVVRERFWMKKLGVLAEENRRL
jgi:hypothetical protein